LPLLSQTTPNSRSRWCGKVALEGETIPENVIVPQAKSSQDTLVDTKSPEEIFDEVYDDSPLPESQADTDIESDTADEEKWGLLYKITVLLVFIVYTLMMYRMAAGPEL